MTLAIYGILCLTLGGVIGVVIGRNSARRRDKAPTPYNLSGEQEGRVMGHINGSRKVTICGAEWTVYGGRQ